MSAKPLLDAVRNLPGARPTPLWIMRQAGRYLPEYRALRERYDTLTMFRTPRLAHEVTLQPLRRFPLDGAIVYADILLIPDACDLGLSFVEGEGPRFSRPVRTPGDVDGLANLDASAVCSRLSYVGETLSRVAADLPSGVTLIGFAGAPWTVASYMIEGKGTGGACVQSRAFMFREPAAMHRLMDTLAVLTASYLSLQVAAGAEIVQVFESWAGVLPPSLYREFALPALNKVLTLFAAKHPGVPVIVYAGEGAGLLEDLAAAPAAVLGLDWRQDLAQCARRLTGSGKALQGNLDPGLLFASKGVMEAHAAEILRAGRAYADGFVFNLGHGIQKTTPVEAVEHLVRFVKGFT